MARPLKPCRALFCDLDGTLADTVPTLFSIYTDFVASRGCKPTPDEFAGLNGLPIHDAVAHLRARWRWNDSLDELVALYEQTIDHEYATADPKPGASDLLAAARAAGWRCAVVTSGKRDRACSWLSAAGLSGFVDALVSGEDVARGKPDPQPYLLGIERVDADPRRSIAVEDSVAGCMSAVTAGLRTYFVGPPGTEPPAGVEAVIDSLRAMLKHL